LAEPMAKRPSDAENLRQITAYHEAGHAVLALALGRPVDWVSIRPDRQFLGLCAFRKAVFRPSEDWLKREAIIALGGLAAEARFTGAYCWEGAGRDYDYVFELAKSRAGNDRQAERLVRRFLSKAEHLLTRPGHWDAVEKIAVELLLLEEISGRAARHFFEDERKKK
jgi:ATP-dependent Zn protease